MRLPAVVSQAVRALVTVSACCGVLAISLIGTRAIAQDSLASGTNAPTANPNLAGSNQQPPMGAAGGGAMQDWSTLMMLIS